MNDASDVTRDVTRDLTAQLLDAHVAHELAQLHASLLPERIEHEVSVLFAWLADVQVDDIVTREQINAVIERYVIDLKISGALTELAGEMSRLVVTSSASAHTRVDQVLQPDEFAQFADKLTGLQAVWRKVLHLVLHSDAYARLVSSTLQRSALDAVFAGTHAAHQPLIEGLLSKLRPLVAQRIEPLVSVYLEALIKRGSQHGEQRLLHALDVEAARGLVDEVWDDLAAMKLSEAFAFVGSADLEDFVVLGYEFWQKYRKTPYFRAISREMVDHFFTKYGSDSVLSLLEEVGVTAAMVTEELQRFVPPLTAQAHASGLLEQRIRARLEPFYRSEAVATILRGPAR